MKKLLNKIIPFLYPYSGEDGYIIRECDLKIQKSFALIGLYVLLISAGCFISASSFIWQLFDNSGKWLSIPIGIVWALLILCLYFLLLQTISPTILPVGKKKTGKSKNNSTANEKPSNEKTSGFSSSVWVRILFILLIATIIAQPLNVLLLSSFSERSLGIHKTEYRINMIIVADSSLIRQELQNKSDFYQNITAKMNVNDSIIVAKNVQLLNDKVARDEIFLIQSRILLDSLSKWNNSSQEIICYKCDSIRNILFELVDEELKSDEAFISSIDNIQFTNQSLQSELEIYRNSLKKNIEAKIDNSDRLDQLLDKSNFYVKKIQILLNESPVAWIITVFVAALFILPIYLKFKIRNIEGFYEKKESIERKIVYDEYNDFKAIYSKLFDDKIKIYNRQSKIAIISLLNKIKYTHPSKFGFFSNKLEIEIVEEKISKYEYWADPPFRTKHKDSGKQLLSEENLLKTIYLGNH